ncbi:peroxiredoxin [Paraburkholderia terricola]|uniref:Peroxiredoxin n=1 Tax=Paraburkholderia terricola TaxID=169427 RepID=A0ABU1M2E0_9BURK|nr:peroxiredoxin [Paraburkholderia terricola]MDR6413199.1 peroxiredoxin [Paraburkholderia terricola]MDR6450085.1 peroxiredoxin [Paraburkholderia terricola]MDR6484864.1 peroxiredoxin [Paraburkholderia terricola]MDR6495726.1 peroxiredoxin [Paraburkholderia terricola]
MSDVFAVDWSTVPAPQDDGLARHLPGKSLPPLALKSTDGDLVDLSLLSGRSVVYAFPRMHRPDGPVTDGWFEIPGAPGCTPQSCAFRDHAAQLKAVGATYIFGLSTQDTQDQRETVDRLHLPFPLLSDDDRSFTHALSLPTFEIAGMVLLKRLTLIIKNGMIEHVFYPVFPPDRNATEVITWLGHRQ